MALPKAGAAIRDAARGNGPQPAARAQADDEDAGAAVDSDDSSDDKEGLRRRRLPPADLD